MQDIGERDSFLHSDDTDSSSSAGRKPRAVLRHALRIVAPIVATLLVGMAVLCIRKRSSLTIEAAAGVVDKAEQRKSQPGRLGSFIVLGDWGYDHEHHGNVIPTCQKLIADKVHATMQQLGDVKFLVNVGDSFYPWGVQSEKDWQWDAKWRNVYSQLARSVPWYSVYGNHDMQHDPCSCTDEPAKCAQVNYNEKDLNYFYMPGHNWFREHPELGLEVIGLEMNDYMWGWNDKADHNQRCTWDCQHTSCRAKCEQSLKARAAQGHQLLKQRLAESDSPNLVVFSHYPTDYFRTNEDFLNDLRNPEKHIEYFGGHRHNIDQNSTVPITPNNNWLVGGGGGWSCDKLPGVPSQQGFIVVEINADYTLTTRPVLVSNKECCKELPPPPPPTGPPPPPFKCMTIN